MKMSLALYGIGELKMKLLNNKKVLELQRVI